MNPLFQFYQDSSTRETFKAFMLAQLDEMALETLYAGKDVKGFQEARELVDKTFSKLKDLYAPKDKAVVESSR